MGNRCIYLIMYHGARHIGDGQLVMTLTLPYGSKIQGGRGQRILGITWPWAFM